MTRVVKYAELVVLHDHHRDVVQLDRIGQGDQRPVGGVDLGRLVVIDPVADIFDAGGGEQLRGLLGLGQAGAEPADRLLAGKALDDADRALDHRALVVDPVDRHLLVGVAHELPAGVAALAGDALVILADPRVDRHGRTDAEPAVQVEKAPHADPHAVFVPGPVRHVGQQYLAGRRRQDLPRHRPRDVPDFEIDDRPDDDAGAARQTQRGAIDDRRKRRAVARDHPSTYPCWPCIAAARRAISSGETSSTWVEMYQRCPNGSSTVLLRSP